MGVCADVHAYVSACACRRAGMWVRMQVCASVACMCVGGCEYACMDVYVGEGIVTLWNSGGYARRAVPLL